MVEVSQVHVYGCAAIKMQVRQLDLLPALIAPGFGLYVEANYFFSNFCYK